MLRATRPLLLLPAVATGCLAAFATPAPVPAATATALYEMRFEATWSAETHPLEFPPSPHSSLIGGAHGAGVSFWRPGALASTGIKDMAERGRTSPLDGEVLAAVAAGTAREVIRGGGISPSPGAVESFAPLRDSLAFPCT